MKHAHEFSELYIDRNVELHHFRRFNSTGNPMAILKSSKKDIRRIAKRTVINKRLKSRIKTMRKLVFEAADASDSSKTKSAAVAYISALDVAANAGVIHHNKVNREKSHYAKYLSAC